MFDLFEAYIRRYALIVRITMLKQMCGATNGTLVSQHVPFLLFRSVPFVPFVPFAASPTGAEGHSSPRKKKSAKRILVSKDFADSQGIARSSVFSATIIRHTI